jgi:hypothetical protein
MERRNEKGNIMERTYEDGIAKGRELERANVIRWLDMRVEETNRPMPHYFQHHEVKYIRAQIKAKAHHPRFDLDHTYRKKSAVFQAFQMTKERRWDNVDWPEWLNYAWNYEVGEVGGVWIDKSDTTGETLMVGTPMGEVKLRPGDYIIRVGDEQLYPCASATFHETYEKANAHKGVE